MCHDSRCSTLMGSLAVALYNTPIPPHTIATAELLQLHSPKHSARNSLSLASILAVNSLPKPITLPPPHTDLSGARK